MEGVIMLEGLPAELAPFSEVVREKPVLAVLEFVAARCDGRLTTILATLSDLSQLPYPGSQVSG